MSLFVKQFFVFSVAVVLGSCNLSKVETTGINDLVLRYDEPADLWTEALPIGNGRQGAMVYGGALQEHIQLNENTLYSGEPSSTYKGTRIRPSYDKVLRFIKSNKYKEAEELMAKNWLGRLHQSYQPFGDLYLNFNTDTILNYQRELNIENSLVTVQYQTSKAKYKREILASYPDNVIAMKISSNKKGTISFSALLKSPHPVKVQSKDSVLILTGQAPGFVLRRTLENVERNGDQHKYPEIFNKDGSRKPFAKQILYGDEVDGKGMFFEGRLKIIAKNGSVKSSEDGLTVSNADEVTLLLSMATSFNGFDKSPSKDGKLPSDINLNILSSLEDSNFEDIKEKHEQDYRSLFNRVEFYLGENNSDSLLFTDDLLKNYVNKTDVRLNTLLFQYGRYLMISGSRIGGQPLNLQGIWNHKIIPSWNSAYTMNINAQMNYWPAEVTNLSECHEPFFTLVKELAVTGKETAKNMYELSGWVAHHNTDIWRPSYPADNAVMYSYWPVAGGWLTDHMWEHYLFTQDTIFLKNEAYPLLKNSAAFFADWLIKNNEGYWVTPVGTSPENSFKYGNNNSSVVSSGPTMDMAIIKENFENVIQASTILGKDLDFRKELEDIKSKMLPYQIGSKGQLQEWQFDFKENDIRHRHLSHLYGFYPGNQISNKDTKLFNAVKKTLELRGDEATGWSMGWKINFWARMHEGNHAYKIIQNLFSFVDEGSKQKHGGLYANLLDAHPPFQIDGNFGYTAGVSEMLLQSHAGEIDILPALPDAWPIGEIKGLKARGNITVGIEWRDHKLVKLSLKSLNNQTLKLKYENCTKKLMLKGGKDHFIDSSFFK